MRLSRDLHSQLIYIRFPASKTSAFSGSSSTRPEQLLPGQTLPGQAQRGRGAQPALQGTCWGVVLWGGFSFWRSLGFSKSIPSFSKLPKTSPDVQPHTAAAVYFGVPQVPSLSPSCSHQPRARRWLLGGVTWSHGAFRQDSGCKSGAAPKLFHLQTGFVQRRGSRTSGCWGAGGPRCGGCRSTWGQTGTSLNTVFAGKPLPTALRAAFSYHPWMGRHQARGAGGSPRKRLFLGWGFHHSPRAQNTQN